MKNFLNRWMELPRSYKVVILVIALESCIAIGGLGWVLWTVYFG